MGLFDQFPYTNNHELNLNWLLQKMKNLEEIYQHLQDEIKEVTDFINNFEEWFNQNVDQKIDERIAVTMSLYLQRLQQIEKLVAQLEEEINKDDGVIGQIKDLQNQIDALNASLTQAKHACAQKIAELLELLHTYKYEMENFVDGKVSYLEQYIVDHVTKVDRLDVINPLNGLYQPIQDVLNSMTEVITRSYGLTAAQYDSLKLSAQVYDNYHITAYDYDTKAYFELYLKLTYNLMISPFTGLLDTYDNIINSLTALHKCAMTAQEYDDAQITAEQYDTFELTAFAYDWWGFIVARPITAGRYDALKLEAEKYDNMMITAGEYEKGMQVLTDMTLSGCNSRCGDYQILASQITELATKVSSLNSTIHASAGTTFVLVTPVGETTTKLDWPNVDENSMIQVLTDNGKVPYRITVTPHEGVEVEWPENVTLNEPIIFNVMVQNKN